MSKSGSFGAFGALHASGFALFFQDLSFLPIFEA
jgi:hypothetical protein